MKKRYLLLMAVLAMVMLVCCACDLGGECFHEFSKWEIVQEGSCAGPGLQTRRCDKCGYTQTEEVQASAAHKEEILAAKAATCTESGLTEGKKCTVCHAELVSQQTIPATGHTEQILDAVAATCTENGLTEGKKCAVCDTQLVIQETIPATGHTEQTVEAVAATCTENGLTEGKKCAVCDAQLVVQETIPATGHTEQIMAAVAATCTTEGLTEGKYCTVCKMVLVEQTAVAAGAHNYTETVTQEAACNAAGIKTFTCAGCGASYEESYEKQSYTATQIHDMAAASVGEIITYDKDGNALSLGSCFAFTHDGGLLTNYHVIQGAYSAKVNLNGVTYDVYAVLGYDAAADVAVLAIDADNLQALPLCGQTHAVGETVYAFGSSQGLTATFSQGIITYADRDVGGVSCVQHDAAISQGNSGGPLINRFGEVVGINTWYLSDAQNLNFAVATKHVLQISIENPLTLAQLYELEHNAYHTMKNYLVANGQFYADDNEYAIVMDAVYSDSSDEYISYYKYDLTYDMVEMCLAVNREMYFYIYVNESGVFGWTYVDVYEDYMYGYYDFADFQEDMPLPYEYYELGYSETAEELSIWASYFADTLCGWLDYDLEPMGLTAEDLGILNY